MGNVVGSEFINSFPIELTPGQSNLGVGWKKELSAILLVDLLLKEKKYLEFLLQLKGSIAIGRIQRNTTLQGRIKRLPSGSREEKLSKGQSSFWTRS